MNKRQKDIFTTGMQQPIKTHHKMEAAGLSKMVVIACDLQDTYGKEFARFNTDPASHPDCDTWYYGLEISNWNARFPENAIPAEYALPVVIVSGDTPVIVECIETKGSFAPVSLDTAGRIGSMRSAFGAGKTHTMMN